MGEPVQEAATQDTVASIAQDATDVLRPQLVSAVDGYGMPALVAVLFTYIIIHISKDLIHDALSKRGWTEKTRNNVIRATVFIPGMLAACIVDITPILAAFKVPVHPLQAIPAGGVFYGGGALFAHWVWIRVRDKFLGGPPPEKIEKDEKYSAQSTGVLLLKDLNPDFERGESE